MNIRPAQNTTAATRAETRAKPGAHAEADAKAKADARTTAANPEAQTGTVRHQDKAALQKWMEMAFSRENTIQPQYSKPKDSSGALTTRLVAAGGQFEVRQVISQAAKDMMSLQVIAATSDGEDAKLARQILKKLQRVVDRGYEKIEGLNGEDRLRIQQRRAEQAQQRQRTTEIKNELREKMCRRKDKEQKYLNEEQYERIFGASGIAPNFDSLQLDAASEAQISAQAQAQAAMEFSAGPGASGGAGTAGSAGSTSGTAAGSSPGSTGSSGAGDAASSGGGEAGGGGINISV